MLIDEIREKLKQAEPEIEVIQTWWKNSKLNEKIIALEKQIEVEESWEDPKHAERLKELCRLREQETLYYQLNNTGKDLHELIDLFCSDEAELEKLNKEINSWIRAIKNFKLNILLTDEQDHLNCFLSVNSGAGGTESQDWAEMLLRMYLRFCEREKFDAAIIDYQSGEAAGIKSATIYVKGKNAYGFLKNEQGIHRLVRISPFDANKRRHTSFAAVTAIPELKKIEVTINPDDLRIDTYRAGGAGGQHVNKTDSAVRITHIPSGIVVQCQNERSQLSNKETAMKMLASKLLEKQKAEEKAKQSAVEKKKIEWGSQIRSYILHPYKLIKDHRTDLESPQPDLVLDGEIIDFIEANLINEQAKESH